MSVSPDRINAFLDAVKVGNLSKMKLLMRAGVPVDCENNTAMRLAVSHGHVEVFNLLLDAGASIDVRNAVGESLLLTACRGGSPEIVATVLGRAQLTQRDLDESLVCPPNQEEILILLLAKGSDPTYIDESGGNCLLHAILFNKSESLALKLFELGADATIRVPRDYEDETIGNSYKMPLSELAERKGMKRLAQAILNRQGDSTPQIKTKLPDTISDCWTGIAELLASVTSDWIFPESIVESDMSKFTNHEIRGNGESAITELYRCIYGTAEFAIFPMPNDVSYSMMCLEDAIRSTEETREVLESECVGSAESSWNTDWFAFAENGAGDFLVINSLGECFQFSHETREATRRSSSLLELLQDIFTGLRTGKYQINLKNHSIE